METIRKGYKQTDIGIIPEDWEVKTIGKIFTSFPTASFSREQLGDGNVKYIHYGDIHTKFGAIVNVETTDLPTVSDSQSNRYVKLRNGDIILADASEDYEGVGKCIEILNCQNTPAISGLHTIPLRDSNNEFVDGLRGYIFQSKNVKSQLDRQAVGTKVYSISYNSIKECLIPIPTKIEQRAIAEVLSDIDSLIEVLNKKIAKKRAIKDGAMQQLLTAKKRLPGFSDPWVEKHVKEMFEVTRGLVLPMSDISGICSSETPFPVYSSQTSNKGIAGYYKNYLFENSITWTTDGANAGEVNFRKGKFYCTNICGVLNSDKGYANLCIAGILNLVSKGYVSYIGNPKLMNNVMADITVLIPENTAEQQAIAQILTDMDDEIELLEQQRSKYTALKQGTMQQLLTGQIRLAANRQIRQTDKSQKQANVHFKRSVWAAEIADRLCNEPTFGHVKMEKMIFLTEHLCGVDIGSNYHRDAAGPYDNRAIRSIDSQLKKQNWFEACRNDKGYYHYTPLVKRGGHKEYFNKYFSDVQADFDKVINIFRNWNTERCEIVATLYSAWKDIASAQKTYSDEDIINEVLNNWHESKKRISIERWQLALKWMKEKGFEPKL